MIARLRMQALTALNTVSSSFWFMPALISLAGIGLAWLTISSEGQALLESVALRSTFTAQGAREILATIAGGVMTVGGVVFSLTFVALSVVAQQLGPRVVFMLMRDRMTQMTLGIFNATFLHSLIALTAISSSEDDAFVPALAVVAAVGLAILSFALVIRFVHAMAMQLQADAVIAHLAHDLDTAIRSTALSADGAPDDPPKEEIDAAARARAEGVPACSSCSGYVQSIDYEAAVKLACEGDAALAFICGPGDFVLRGRPIAHVAQGEVDPEALISECVRLGPRRTAVGNISFELNALVNVALRALSPSLNDPNTAIACFHHLADALALLARQPMRSIIHKDEDGRARVYESPRVFADHLNLVCTPLVPAALASELANLSLRSVLRELIEAAPTKSQKESLARWLEVLTEPSKPSRPDAAAA